MAGDHDSECPGEGCHARTRQRTLRVFQLESKDTRYCQECGFGDEVALGQRRHVAPTTLSVRDRSSHRAKEEGIRPLRKR